jgi:hypothetical protein
MIATKISRTKVKNEFCCYSSFSTVGKIFVKLFSVLLALLAKFEAKRARN